MVRSHSCIVLQNSISLLCAMAFVFQFPCVPPSYALGLDVRLAIVHGVASLGEIDSHSIAGYWTFCMVYLRLIRA